MPAEYVAFVVQSSESKQTLLLVAHVAYVTGGPLTRDDCWLTKDEPAAGGKACPECAFVTVRVSKVSGCPSTRDNYRPWAA